MSTETSTTEQEQWVLVDPLVPGGLLIEKSKLVLITPAATGNFAKDVETSMRDPARVLNVSAYPEVVEALSKAAARFDRIMCLMGGVHLMTGARLMEHEIYVRDCRNEARATLSDVHPAQGDKG